MSRDRVDIEPLQRHFQTEMIQCIVRDLGMITQELKYLHREMTRLWLQS